jgi:hypothetical protein
MFFIQWLKQPVIQVRRRVPMILPLPGQLLSFVICTQSTALSRFSTENVLCICCRSINPRVTEPSTRKSRSFVPLSLIHSRAFRKDLCVLGSDLVSIPRGPPCALLEDGRFPLGQHGRLPLVDALEPVSEAAADAGKDGPGPEGGLVEEGAHLEAELPEADGDACLDSHNCVSFVMFCFRVKVMMLSGGVGRRSQCRMVSYQSLTRTVFSKPS